MNIWRHTVGTLCMLIIIEWMNCSNSHKGMQKIVSQSLVVQIKFQDLFGNPVLSNSSVQYQMDYSWWVNFIILTQDH